MHQKLKMSLPMYFCVEHFTKYKVYMNSIYSYKNTSVVWPETNIVARAMTIKLRNDHQKTTSYRKWNGKDYKSLSWTFTGSYIDMTLNDRHITIVCPVISVSDPGILPFNTFSLRPSRETFVDEVDTSTYDKADVFERDPNSSEYITPLERSTTYEQPVEPRRVREHLFVSSCTGGVCSTKPAKKGLPAHVANIVLGDAISKNEVCPISSETITRENASVTSCGHVFCKSSLDTWFNIKDECPVCKQKCT